MTRLQIIVLSVALAIGAYHLGLTSGRDYAYGQFEQLDQDYPCGTDTECLEMFGEDGVQKSKEAKVN